MKLGKILPSLRYPSDNINILLSGMISLMRTNFEYMFMGILSTDQLLNKGGIPLQGYSLLVVLEEAYIPQEELHSYSSRSRVQIPLPLFSLPLPNHIVLVQYMLLLLHALLSLHN